MFKILLFISFEYVTTEDLKIALEPLIETIDDAIIPPVQLSAVVTVNFFSKQL